MGDKAQISTEDRSGRRAVDDSVQVGDGKFAVFAGSGGAVFGEVLALEFFVVDVDIQELEVRDTEWVEISDDLVDDSGDMFGFRVD